MTISVGDKLPDVTLFEVGEAGAGPQTTAEVFGGKKVVVFGVPGAFTGTCHNKHIPGYVEHADAMRAKGADEIVCLSVNDPFVMEAWGQATGASASGIRMIGDSAADLAKACEITFDGSARGLGVRLQRFAAIVEDGTITALNVEEAPGLVEVSSAETMLALL